MSYSHVSPYTGTPVLSSLEQEIEDAALATALEYSSWEEGFDQVELVFASEPSTADKATADSVVAAHSGDPGKPGATKVELKDGVDEPATITDCAQIYVDVTDGDLKVKFGDGTIKTIAIDS